MAKPKDPGLRLRLIEAASAEFAEKGFGATNLSDIGERADVTKGGVYFHFRGPVGTQAWTGLRLLRVVPHHEPEF